jgi:F-type H+-transporting ATPase subunit b
MKMLRSLTRRPLVLLAGLLSAFPMFAAEEGGNAAEQTLGMGFKWFHFVVIAVLAYWVFAKVLPPFFRHKADNISSAIEKATAAKTDAERQLKEAVERLGNLEPEVAAFREQAQRDAVAEMERLRNATQLDLDKIRAAANAEMAAAERAARVELKELAAKLAVDGAESLLAKQMTPAVQEAMISSFVQSLQGRPN